MLGRSAFCAAILLAAPSAQAQLRASAAGPDEIAIRSVRGLVLFDGDREDLVLELGYEATTPTGDLAWTLPLPSSAEHFSRAGDDPFAGLGLAAPRDPVIEAAPYAMVPLRARGEGATFALAAWLRDGGFHPWPEGALAPYAEREWVFFVARARPVEGSEMPTRGRLPALHVRFRADRPIVPLRLATSIATAQVSLAILTIEAPTEDALAAARAMGFRVERDTLAVGDADPALAAVLSQSSAFPMASVGGGVLAVTRLSTTSLDVGAGLEELAVPGAGPAERIVGLADRVAPPEAGDAGALVADAGSDALPAAAEAPAAEDGPEWAVLGGVTVLALAGGLVLALRRARRA